MKDYTVEKRSISVMRTTRGKSTERWTGADSSVLRSIVNILPGVTIGENAIIGTGSIVTKDIPDNAVAVGNPAKVVKMIEKRRTLNAAE